MHDLTAGQGQLSRHPLICGLSLQCARMVEKHEKNIFTMAGRRSSCSEKESWLISDAGQQLALAACNMALAREFGISSKFCRISLDDLHASSLPCPALSVRWPEVLQENWKLMDQRFVRAPETPQRSWAFSSCSKPAMDSHVKNTSSSANHSNTLIILIHFVVLFGPTLLFVAWVAEPKASQPGPIQKSNNLTVLHNGIIQNGTGSQNTVLA